MKKMNCPVCKKPLTTQRGTQLDPKDGVTAFCSHRDCPAAEVSGHEGNAAAAFKVVEQKFERS